ncbi:ATP12 family chaperone protein [Aurantiacibacter sp. MUD11]|uniref:ATP12 family chaperone protein n=1 Tax=Aurantiacibacter sp. MUD11 TaxID=3003265 RepID=UPI0022AA6662|nr:ATP12 family chaperone protein [Aurantiacibacter sp. MUD11]WAT19127.1 ATP12 family chaperone protein [Aurantiacibacter sp. MUD11]
MKKFWKDVSVEERDGGWQVTLDGRAIRTQGGQQQVAPSRALADLVAGEFAAQGEEIDTRSFVFRDMVDYALDIVAKQREATVTQLLEYAQTDTLCYRADPDEPLYKRQQELWEPLVSACEATHGIRLERASGIIHRPQPEDSIAALRQRLEAEDHFSLAGLQTITSLAASLVVALAALEDQADTTALFAAANAEQDWQAELWGWDFAAEEARKAKLEAFEKAAQFLRAARG